MIAKENTFFDDIIQTLTIRSESDKFAKVSPDTLNEFYSKKAITPKEPPAMEKETIATTAPVSTVPSAPMTPGIPKDLGTLDLNNLKDEAIKQLSHNNNKVIFGIGNPKANLMFIGDTPTIEDERQGIPFSGEEGQMITKMINAMGFKRPDIYLTTLLKYRSTGIDPESDEVNLCMPYLQRQIELVAPKVIVTFGALPLKYLLNKNGLSSLRGQWDQYNGIFVMPTFHPSYLLRMPDAKQDTWRDLQQVMKVFKTN